MSPIVLFVVYNEANSSTGGTPEDRRAFSAVGERFVASVITLGLALKCEIDERTETQALDGI